MKNIVRGDIVEHPVRGRGVVTFVGNDYVGMDGEQPPQVGQDIEGTLWLQGHLWCPHK